MIFRLLFFFELDALLMKTAISSTKEEGLIIAQEPGIHKTSDMDTLMRLLGNPETAGLLKQLVKAMDN